MIKIFFNPNFPELIYTIAAILKNDLNEIAILIPTTPAELKSYQELRTEITETVQDILENEEEKSINSEDGSNILYQEKIFLLNIYPINKEENSELINFFDENREKIKGWIDSHYSNWNKAAVNYISENPKIIRINQGGATLRSLKEMGFNFPAEWLETYLAMKNQDVNNKEAFRYLIIFSATEIILNNAFIDGLESLSVYSNIFSFAAEEIATKVKNKNFDMIFKEYLTALKTTTKLKKAFKTNNHLFKKAQAAGKPVGLLRLGKINPYLNLGEIMYHGKRKFPWLCIITYEIQDESFLQAESSKIHVEEIFNKYRGLINKPTDLFPIFEKELLKIK